MKSLLDTLDPQIAEALFLFLTTTPLWAGLGWLGLVIRSVLQTKAAREALHSALHTGVDFITDEIADLLSDPSDMLDDAKRWGLIKSIRSYVWSSVPDSIEKLKASDLQIERMAKAYLNDRLIDLGLINRISTKRNHDFGAIARAVETKNFQA